MTFRATLAGFSAILMWALLALFTAASGKMPPFQLAAICFAVGSLPGIGVFIARPERLKLLKQPAAAWATGVIGLFGYAVPAFWLGLVGLAVFYARLQWVGGPGRIDIFYDGLVDPITGLMLIDTLIAGETEIFWNAVLHLVLPASVLGFFSLAYIARMTRSFMLDQLAQEYVTTARVKGVPERLVIWRHAFRPILVPLITVCGLSYAGLLEGSVMIETIFSWPGIGNYLTVALLNADMSAVLGATLVIGAVFIGINKISDALYRILDPRAR